MKNRRILYAASSMSHIERFHLDYISALKELGNEVTVMASGAGADIDIRFEKRIFSVKNLLNGFKIRKILQNQHFDALILNTSLAAFWIRAALGKNRPKTVYIVHGFLFKEKKNTPREALFLIAERLLGKRTDALIVMNGEDLRIASKFRLAKRIFTSRGMGCEIREIITSPEHIRYEFFGERRFVLCFVGELSKRKNQAFLIRGVAALKTKIPGILLCLVGDGKERENLAQLAAALGIHERVVFTSERSDACDFIRACDLYVSASHGEGLPFNLIEALGAGRTVLASNVKGHADIIDDEIDGFLYKSENLFDFVNKTYQIYRRIIFVKEENVRKKYLKFSKPEVLSETLSKILEAIK